ncbi:hypothetical protein RFI_35248 [Reticulomyxa filosa]|uniref:Uncharacterized protein n=1 Tax=Reticulomyxa filosa TaxID=46433 RepID=X6LJP9_RETFI|nr:hypothetical protein RFI_35248 [Reticulomyxa filosa]|eukprot:ETO02188.1 hypothetical protein RFI_35248 [Reticulomyxa filosa]
MSKLEIPDIGLKQWLLNWNIDDEKVHELEGNTIRIKCEKDNIPKSEVSANGNSTTSVYVCFLRSDLIIGDNIKKKKKKKIEHEKKTNKDWLKEGKLVMYPKDFKLELEKVLQDNTTILEPPEQRGRHHFWPGLLSEQERRDIFWTLLKYRKTKKNFFFFF